MQLHGYSPVNMGVLQKTISKVQLWTAASEARNCIQFFCESMKFSLAEYAQQHWGWNYFTPNHLLHFKQKLNFVSLTALWKSFVFFLQQNILSRLSSLLHSVWLEILRKLRIFPKENFIRHNNMSNERPVKLKLYYLKSEIT